MSTSTRLALTFTLSSLLLPAMAQAGDDDKRFSIAIGAGIRPDMAGLGSTIVQDGSVDVADTSLAALAYSTDKLLVSDRNNMTLKANSDKTNSVFNVLSDFEQGGSMLGLEIGGDARYEFDDVIDFPLFLDVGFYYSTRMSGGQQSRTLGNIAEQSETIQLISAVYGLDTADYVGGKMITEWNASWMEIPISVGLKTPTKRPLTYAYGNIGVSIFSGGFDIGINADEKYLNVLNTHVIENGTPIPDLIDQSPDGGIQDTISFRTGAVGLNYGLGVQAGVGKHVAFFIELNSSGAAKTVYASAMQADTKRVLTSASSATLADQDSGDPVWFQDIAYPVVMQGASGRLGFRAYVF